MLIDNIKKKLKSKLSELEYNSYISLLEYDEEASRSDLEVFYVPNILVANWIKSSYLDEIASAFASENSSGTRPEIHIKVKEQKQNVKSLNINKSPSHIRHHHPLNPDHRFENFFVCGANKHAHLIATIVSKEQGVAYNPVLIYGRSGIGKTHLLSAIGNFVQERGKNVLYLTAENFMNDFTEKLRLRNMDSFREKYRKCDYLLIDDVQFFSNKADTQEELLHTFNALTHINKQIVLTSDKPPKDIIGLEDRLRSRFEGGIMTEMTSYDLEAKISIITSKCEMNRISLGKEVIGYIASNLHDNIRQIEGVISTIYSHKNLSPEIPELSIAKSVLKNYQIQSREGITIDSIKKAVSKELNIKQSEITSPSRSQRISFARRVVLYLARSLLSINSMSMLAKECGMKDHSAASKAIKKLEQEMSQDEALKMQIHNLKSRIEQDVGNK